MVAWPSSLLPSPKLELAHEQKQVALLDGGLYSLLQAFNRKLELLRSVMSVVRIWIMMITRRSTARPLNVIRLRVSSRTRASVTLAQAECHGLSSSVTPAAATADCPFFTSISTSEGRALMFNLDCLKYYSFERVEQLEDNGTGVLTAHFDLLEQQSRSKRDSSAMTVNTNVVDLSG